MRLASLNTPAVANAGAVLVTVSTGALGHDVTQLVALQTVNAFALIAPFVGIAIGLFLAYIGRPEIKLSAPAETADATAPAAPLQMQGEIMSTPIGAVADGLVAALESPAAQTALTTAIAAGEVDLKVFGDKVISNAKGSGVLGIAIAAAKGSVEAEFDAELAKLTPQQIAAYITQLAVNEAKALGG